MCLMGVLREAAGEARPFCCLLLYVLFTASIVMTDFDDCISVGTMLICLEHFALKDSCLRRMSAFVPF